MHSTSVIAYLFFLFSIWLHTHTCALIASCSHLIMFLLICRAW